MSNTNEPATTISLVLQNGETLECSQDVWMKASGYFAALFAENASFAESHSGTVELKSLDPRAVRTVYEYLKSDLKEFPVWPGFRWGSDDSAALLETLDYLQIGSDDEKWEALVSAIAVLHDRNNVLSYCKEQGWIDQETENVTVLPSGKKKRIWRFWVCYLLCLQLAPTAEERMDQQEFTDKIHSFAFNIDAVALRRELIEYGLIEREGDGSAYWRPQYTVGMLQNHFIGMPRKVI